MNAHTPTITDPRSPIPDPDTRTVGDIGERALIDRIRVRVPSPPSWVVLGIGDDAAVVAPERNALDVITTDALVEGVHFDLAVTGPADIGHKALAVNLSDLAAMGAAPRVALLSLMLPPAWPVADFDSMLEGVLALADRAHVSLVGGNITRSPGPLIIDVTVTGSVHPRRILRRAGARPGDDLYVTGSLGGAAAALRAGRVFRPEPRTRFGVLLGRNRVARACVDLSDGLADGIRQIAEASGVGATIDAGAVPIGAGAGLDDALSGGEDYELLFTVSPKMRRRLHGVQRLVKDLPVARVGHVTADRSLILDHGGRREALPAGFVHFGQ